MIEYRVNNHTNTTNINWLAILQGGVNVAGDRAVIAFANRKGITRVPMGFYLNGAANAVLTTAIVTDSMAACEAVMLLGCDNAGAIQHIGFTHVTGAYPPNVDWVRLSAGIMACQTQYAVLEVNSSDSSRNALYAHVRDSLQIPDANILIYNQGRGEQGGRTFGIDSQGNVGEVDTDLVKRNTAAGLDNNLRLSGFMGKNPGIQYDSEVYSMKVPK